jgi:hypothetical protein
MVNLRPRSDGLRIIAIAFMTLAIAASGLVSSLQTAAADSDVNLWAVPVTSCIDDGKLQILRLKFNLENVNPLEKIRITLDPGTPEEKILEFDGNGAILASDPAFVSVDGSIKFKTDGYYFLLAHLKGKFKVGIDKGELIIGDHEALAEIFTDGASTTPSDDASFKLKACGKGEPDLVAESYVAPNNIKQDKKYHTYFLESNGGNAKAGPHEVYVYLSSDATLDTSSDLLVGKKHTGALPVNPVRLVHIQVEIPCGEDTGEMFLIAFTDAEEEVNESNENNNTELDEVNVIACEEDSLLSTADEDDDDDNKGKKDKVENASEGNKGKGKKDD